MKAELSEATTKNSWVLGEEEGKFLFDSMMAKFSKQEFEESGGDLNFFMGSIICHSEPETYES